MSVNWLQGSTIVHGENKHKDEEGTRNATSTNLAITWAGLKRCLALYAFIMVWLVSFNNARYKYP
jgi:hypothetical protein